MYVLIVNLKCTYVYLQTILTKVTIGTFKDLYHSNRDFIIQQDKECQVFWQVWQVARMKPCGVPSVDLFLLCV